MTDLMGLLELRELIGVKCPAHGTRLVYVSSSQVYSSQMFKSYALFKENKLEFSQFCAVILGRYRASITHHSHCNGVMSISIPTFVSKETG